MLTLVFILLLMQFWGCHWKGVILANIFLHQKKSENKNSLFFLEYAASILDEEKFKINNLDLTIICEKPKISKYKEKMKKKLVRH